MYTEAKLLEKESLIFDNSVLSIEVLLSHILHRNYGSGRGERRGEGRRGEGKMRKNRREELVIVYSIM